MALADFLSNLFGANNQGSPFEQYINPEQKKALTRNSWMTAAQQLRNAPDLFSGLVSGLGAGQESFGAGMEEMAKKEMARRKLEEDLAREKLAMEQIRQSMSHAVNEEARRAEDQVMDKESHGVSIANAKSGEERAIKREGREEALFERGTEEYNRAKELRAGREKAGREAAEYFGKTPEEKALYSALAEAEEYGTLWNSIAQRSMPSVERWSDPEARPGIGLVQRNLRTGQVSVLWKEPQSSASSTVKPKTVTVSPSQINKMKFDILEKELIPKFLKENQKVDRLGPDFLYDLFGAEEAPVDHGPMTMFGSIEIPAKLVQEAEQRAIKDYTTTYRSAWEKVNGRTLEGEEVSSPKGGAVPNNNISTSLSSKLQLEMAVRMKIDSMAEFQGMDDDDKDLAVSEILEQVEQRIKSTGGTYESAIEEIIGNQ